MFHILQEVGAKRNIQITHFYIKPPISSKMGLGLDEGLLKHDAHNHLQMHGPHYLVGESWKYSTV